MVKLGHAKLLVGSSAACTIGGWNAHAANIVAAMFLATGQDAAQVVSSSMCLTQLTKRPEDGALHITCTMNCLEVGTIGGGTVLSPQTTCLEVG
jgi:hydroxymethylglutaryl-CoA reductase (NADPH)